jgi:hypothetical protein
MSAIEQHRPISAPRGVTPQKLCRSARAFTARNNMRRSTALPVPMTRQYLRNARRSLSVWTATRSPRPSFQHCAISPTVFELRSLLYTTAFIASSLHRSESD